MTARDEADSRNLLSPKQESTMTDTTPTAPVRPYSPLTIHIGMSEMKISFQEQTAE